MPGVSLHEPCPYLGRRARKYFGKLPVERAAPGDFFNRHAGELSSLPVSEMAKIVVLIKIGQVETKGNPGKHKDGELHNIGR